MKIGSVADVKAHFSAYLKECEGGPVIVTRNGKAVAVLLPVRDDEELEDLVLAHSPRFRAILETSRSQIHAGQAISHKDFWAEADASTPKLDTKEPEKAVIGRLTARRK
jgi:prevent-host-death family protein